MYVNLRFFNSVMNSGGSNKLADFTAVLMLNIGGVSEEASTA